MASRKKKRIKSRKQKRHLILIIVMVTAGVFFFFQEFGREDIPERVFNIFKTGKKAGTVLSDIPPHKRVPKVSIIMDDLGPNKKTAEAVLDIEAPLTLSILPHEVYTAWIASEGERLRHEIIGHLPMEATKPLKLGKGGLYTWMTDTELIETLDKNLRSIPNIIGVSSHMGSAFTQDKRAMNVVISELKKRELFFLDSRTSSKSVALKLAKKQGVTALSRDVFLDYKDSPSEIKAQWERLIKIAGQKGHAIALVHPRKNTIQFLQHTLKNNNEVEIVPLSEIVSLK